MGNFVTVEGTDVPIEEDTTVADLRETLDRDPEELATFEDNGEIVVMGDRDHVVDVVPDGASISFQPGEGQVFG